MDVSEHGGEVWWAEASEVGGPSCSAFGIAEREGVGDGNAWLDEAEQAGGGLGCVWIEHASEEVDVVCGPGVCIGDECVECVVTPSIGTCDEEAEGVPTLGGQRETEGERAAGWQQQEPLSLRGRAPDFGRRREVGGGGSCVGAGGGAGGALPEGEENDGGGEVAEGVGEA